MRAAVGLFVVLGTGLQVAATTAACAQAPVPLQRSVDYAPLQAKVAEQATAQPQPTQQAQTQQAPAPTTVNKDRFGNIVRGTTCADHPANCAYDPTRPRR